MTYFQGFLIPVPEGKKDAYLKLAEESAPFFEEFGAQRTVETWADDVPRGENTDMYRATKAEDGETIVFSWIDWESKEACDKAHDDMTKDERMEEPAEMPFDGMRMIYAGFEKVGESGTPGKAGYVQGYVAPVKPGKKADFAEMCAGMREVAIDAGAIHAMDGWADDIADGTVNDFKQAVKAEDGEAVGFGLVQWPSKEAFEQGMAKMHNDERMPPPDAEMPVDGKRLIFGGFTPILRYE